jgi:hypothetical protein
MHNNTLIYLTKPPDFIGVAEVVCKAMNSPYKVDVPLCGDNFLQDVGVAAVTYI